jgi:nickel-dependent lactate racemase
LVGIDPFKPDQEYSQVGLYNHNWSDQESLVTIGNISRDEVIHLAGDIWHPSLGGDVPVNINKAVLEYDHIIILGPTFPHEIVGFSGGGKYLFPGISGPEMIHATHWLGALTSNLETIGIRETPVREMIHRAAAMIPTAVTLVALVVDDLNLAGIFIGDVVDAWRESADLSAERHIRWFDKPFHQVLSCPSRRYDELWTAAKAMFKLEPVVRKGGEIIIYAPQLESVSKVHGDNIFGTGYHIMPFFLENWSKFKHIPLGVLAHLTYLPGNGIIKDGVEIPDIHITLSSKISEEDCKRLNLGYIDPRSIWADDFANREEEGVLYVPDAGEILHKLRRRS